MQIPQCLGRLPVSAMAFVCMALSAGCAQRLDFPPMGPTLPYAARLELAPSVAAPTIQYTDSCGHIQEIRFGSMLEEAVIESAYRTFQSVSVGASGAKDPSKEVAVRVDLVQYKLGLKQDNVYDRVPADMQLGGLAKFYDSSGRLLREADIQVNRNERLRIEPIAKNCDYIIDPFLRDSAVEFASKFMQEAREAFTAGNQTAAAPTPSGAGGAPTAPLTPPPPQFGAGQALVGTQSTVSPLRFKATVLDENSNLVFEGGERIRVRIDLVNGGEQELQGVIATLAGTASLLAQFPTATLTVGRLQPGLSRSIEFVATLPQSVQKQKAEIQVTVSDSGTRAQPPIQTLTLSIQPSGIKADDVDHIPAMANGFRQPHTYLISIGIGSYRDQQVPSRKFASLDAEMVSTYFQSLGGLPTSNVRLLQDWKALRPDIDEALLDWLPPHMNKEAIVIVYFAGLASVSSTGETFLVPYDGTATTTSRAYPLKDLEAALSRLKAKQTVFLFDGIVARMGPESKTKGILPQWNPTGSSTLHVIGTSGIGRGLEDDQHRHGLFTYYLLRALRGEADTNRDGDVTLGETVTYLSQKVLWASKTQMNQEQRPFIAPTLRLTDPSTALILTKLAAIQGAEAH